MGYFSLDKQTLMLTLLYVSLIKICCGVGKNSVHYTLSLLPIVLCAGHTHLLKPNTSSVSVNVPQRRYNQITGARFKELAKASGHCLCSVCCKRQSTEMSDFPKHYFVAVRAIITHTAKEFVTNFPSICLQLFISWVLH
jgi:hypothetical protein